MLLRSKVALAGMAEGLLAAASGGGAARGGDDALLQPNSGPRWTCTFGFNKPKSSVMQRSAVGAV